MHTIVKQLFCLMIFMLLAGCASTRVEQGQELLVQFRCSLPNGELLATSEVDPTGPRSAAWQASAKPGPLRLTAGKPPKSEKQSAREDFEQVLASGLAMALPGLKLEQSQQVMLQAQPVRRPDGTPRTVTIAKTLLRKKELRMTPEQYRIRKRKDAVVGDSYVIDPRVPGTVAKVDEQQVLIRFSPRSFEPFNTPYGMARVVDTGEQYEIRYEPVLGSLVRTGPMLGIISNVTDRHVTLDYTNPFGGAELTCTITPLPAGPVAETKGAAHP
jgi:hypothetical protein